MPIAIKPIHGSVIPSGDSGRKRILVCVPNYLPGYKSGGPIRAIANMITQLSPHLDFYVVTRDRDAGDAVTYSGVTPDAWHQVGSARVLYCSAVSASILRCAFREVQPDVLYLNSFQDPLTRVAVLLRRTGAFGDVPTIMAPRGEFSSGAMKIKPAKKLLYRHITRLFGLHDGLLWQASASREKSDLLRAAPAHHLDPGSVYISGEISDAVPSNAPHPAKTPGLVQLAFIARISEMKNLHFLFEVLQHVRGEVQLNLFGPVDEKDAPYWKKCQALLGALPASIKVVYRGSVDHSAVSQLLHEHHFFVLPTKGENFCHAAVESFLNGTPVILSDETPWTNLEAAHAGFDLPLRDRKAWIAALQQCVDMDQPTYETYLSGTREYRRRFSTEEATRDHLALFHAALDRRSGSGQPS